MDNRFTTCTARVLKLQYLASTISSSVQKELATNVFSPGILTKINFLGNELVS